MHFALLTCAALALTVVPSSALPGDEIATLLATDGDLLDRFGSAVAISGTKAVVGAPRDDAGGEDAGAAYVFDALTGAEIRKIVAADAGPYGWFGASVATHGDLVLIGSPGDDVNGVSSGAAYLFDLQTGQQLVKYLPADGALGDRFGGAVALFGDTALIGAPEDNDNGSDSGSAYVFDAGTGAPHFKLVGTGVDTYDRFGCSVALDGATALIGADDRQGIDVGAAYLFDVTTGVERGTLLPGGGSGGDEFGGSVALHGSRALVGAHLHDAFGTDAGAAYLFNTATLALITKLHPNDAHDTDRFGASVALSDDVALVGAPGDNNGALDAGAAYFFDLATGQQVAKLSASDGEANDDLGGAVAVGGFLGLAGAIDGGVSAGGAPGAAYVFTAEYEVAVPYCFGTGAGTPCPCANAGANGHGCANSAFPAGARLWGDGTPSASDDSLALRVEQSRPLQAGLYFQGNDALNGGLGLPFGDGLRCAGNGVLRLEVDAANANGLSATTVPIAITAGIETGDTKRYQWWYRDSGVGPCGSGFNLANGLEVVWGP